MLLVGSVFEAGVEKPLLHYLGRGGGIVDVHVSRAFFSTDLIANFVSHASSLLGKVG
jgi:hypothetical protein